jgi:hypothetical protein
MVDMRTIVVGGETARDLAVARFNNIKTIPFGIVIVALLATTFEF